MALFDLAWYLNAGDQSTTGYYAVAKWIAGTTYTCGAIIRQKTAPAVNSERCYVCYNSTGGTGQSAAVTEPTFPTTRGGQVTDNTVKWQEITGIPALNGDLTAGSMPVWTAVKNTAVTLGACIVSGDGTKILLCTVAGTAGNGAEPTWAAYTTTGATTADNTVTWVTIGDSTTHRPANGAAPHARLQAVGATNWYVAGNTVYIGDNHAETTTAAINFAPATTATSMGLFLCHDHTTNYPPTAADLKTTATISTTAAGVNINSNGGNYYMYGVIFKAGSGVSSGVNSINLQPTSPSKQVFEKCQFQLLNSVAAGASQIAINQTTAATVYWINCTVKFAIATNFISTQDGIWYWRNNVNETTGTILISGSAVPTNFIKIGGNTTPDHQSTTFEGLDLSDLTGALAALNQNSVNGFILLKDCKLNASFTFPITYSSRSGISVQLISSDSTGTAYKHARYSYNAAETTETSITRVGGALDPALQAQSRKIVTTAAAAVGAPVFTDPYTAEPMAIWNGVTGANVTATIYGTINSASLPNNDELWVDLEYFGTASFPLGVHITSAKATVLTASSATGANANITTDSSTWNGGGSGAGWTPFKIQFLLDTTHNPQPQFAGMIHARVRAAKPGATYYIDPKIVLS